jgi:hypothetical protein
MAFPLLGSPKPAFFDSSGSPLASGTLAVLDPSDDANKASYPSADDADAATNANVNPIVLDSRGEPPTGLFGIDGEDYKLTLKDSAGATVWTVDDVFLPTDVAENDIRRFGAKVDGSTDDSAAITSALASFNSIYIPEGTTVITSAITLTDDQAITGSGWRTSVITMTGVGTRINLADKTTLSDFKLSGDTNQTFGISATATAARWQLNRLWINSVISGIGLNNCWIGTIQDCVISTCTNGIFVHDGLSSNGPVNAINVIGGEIASCTYGIRFALNGGAAFAVNSFNVYGGTIEPSGTYGVWVEDVGVGSIKFDGVYWESCGDACYRQDTGVSIIKFIGGRMALDNNAATDKGIHITAGVSGTLSVDGVDFNRGGSSTATDAIFLDAAATISRTLIQNNNKGNANLVYVNNLATTNQYNYFSDDFETTRIVHPSIVDWRELVTTTNVITAEESGRTFYLADAGGFTSTLPAPDIGLKYTFIVKTAPTTAYVITTDSGDNLLYGTFLDIVGELTYFSAQDTLNFVANTSVIGDRLEVESDGVNWYCKAISGADGGITVSVT